MAANFIPAKYSIFQAGMGRAFEGPLKSCFWTVERGKDQSNNYPTEKAAQVRRHANLRRPQIKGCLDCNNYKNVLELPACQGRPTVAQEKAGGNPNHAHDGARGANKLRLIRAAQLG